MKIIIAAAILAAASTPAFAASHMSASTFQNTCSNIGFEYGPDGGAMISAVCLKADGMPNETSIAMPPIGNNDGTLEMGGDAATFQKSCGDITLVADIDGVTLHANCRKSDGSFVPASVPVSGIGNNDGTLSN